MEDAVGSGGAVGYGDAPSLSGDGDEHLAAGGADTAERVPVEGSGHTSTGKLTAVVRLVEVGLLDMDGAPVGVEFFGEEHGEHGLDALADLGILGHKGDGAVGGDVDEGARREVRLHRLARLCGGDGGLVEVEREASSEEGAHLQECTAIEWHGRDLLYYFLAADSAAWWMA